MIWQSVGLGLIAGMRSMLAPTVARYITKHKSAPKIQTVLTVLAVAELIGDKLPFAPPRIKPIGLIARSISGGLSAAYITGDNNDNRIAAGAIGLTSAIASAFAFYCLRSEAGKKLNIDDYLLGITEDALAAGVALTLIKSNQSS